MRAARPSRALRRKAAVLWDAVEQRKKSEATAYAAVFAAAEAALATDPELAGAEFAKTDLHIM